MPSWFASTAEDPGRRNMLKLAAAMATASPLGLAAQPASTAGKTRTQRDAQSQIGGGIGKGRIGYMLADEQFKVPKLVELGHRAASGGFQLLATSDHYQPWQASEAHSGAAWVTLGALSTQVSQTWMGTTVTCPILRYSPAVVVEAFASMDQLAPGRIFLGVGSGEALNEEAATGTWRKWPVEIERRAASNTPFEQVVQGWPISADPGPHLEKIHELQESGVTIVNIHAGQPDQRRVIEVYASRVLPKLPHPA